MIFAMLIASAITHSLIAGQSPQSTGPAPATTQASADKPPLEIISHKISAEHYPILDERSEIAPPMTADIGDWPRLRNEPLPSHSKFDVAPELRREEGRPHSYTRIVDNARQIQAVVKNIGSKAIKAIEWDFPFPRYQNGQFLQRYSVTTKVGIIPGGQKTLKYRLPPGAKRCEVGRVTAGRQTANRIEVVCAQNFSLPPLLNLKQEPISIKRIEYVDGSVWERQ
jgi:hypothetical protein